jgi:hypothetical protein
MKKLFVISYSHAQTQRLMIRLLIDRLNALGVQEFADVWWDAEIPSGAVWASEIERKFEAADGYFVLGSSEYEKSKFIIEKEWPIIERRVGAGKARLFWLSMDRSAGGFQEPVCLSRFQSTIGRTAPLNEAKESERRECLEKLAEEIALFLAGVSEGTSKERPPKIQTPREVEASYLDALRSQCDSLLNRDLYLPMQRLYVRLKADARTASELKASEELMNKSIQTEFLEAGKGGLPATASAIIEDHLRQLSEVKALPHEASWRYEVDSLENIFQKHRFLVVRGAPGSGKTVLCWKIAVTLGEAWRQEFEHGGGKALRKMTEFGPVRLPILLPIRDFAKELRQRNGDLPFAEYLGRHLGKEHATNAGMFNGFLLEQIKGNRSILLLDGLDEVPAMDRRQIVELIQQFLRVHVVPVLGKVDDNPGDVGGNQLLITSRLAGYELAPITESAFRHFVVRPFDDQAIEDYCRHWAEIRFRTRSANFGALADELVRSVLRNSSPTIRELAQNPLLLQVLCELTAAWDEPGDAEGADGLKALPRSRSAIYQKAIHVMAKRWEVAYEGVAEKNEHLRLLLQPGKVEVLLAHVALEMHSSEVLGRTTAEKLREWLELAIERVGGRPVFRLRPDEVSRAISDLIELMRTHLGVISETAPGVFAFHHLTFQEYLAGKALCLRRDGKGWESAAILGRELAEKLPDARWREPALFAFGGLGLAHQHDPTAPDPSDVLDSIRQVWREKKPECTPEEAALLTASLVQELSDELIGGLCETAIRELAGCYRDWGNDGKSVPIAEPFVHALSLLRRRLSGLPLGSGAGNPFDSAVADVIRSDPELAAPLARVCVDRVWLEPAVVEAFSAARGSDLLSWGWPIHQGLRRALLDKDWEPMCVAGDRFARPDASATIQARINYDRSLEAWREKKQVEQERSRYPIVLRSPRMREVLRSSVEWLRKDSPSLLRVIMALCGGFKDYQCARWKAEYASIARFLQLPDSVREGIVNNNPEAFLPRWGSEDVIFNMAVYLDTKQGGRSSLAAQRPEFSLDAIPHDPTPEMLRVIETAAARPSSSGVRWADLLGQLAAKSSDSAVAAEACVALLACGHALPEAVAPNVREKAALQCRRTCDALRDVVVRFAQGQKPKEVDGAAGSKSEATDRDGEDIWHLLDRWLPTLPEDEAVSVFGLVMRTLVEATGLPVKPGLTWRGAAASPLDLCVWAEEWAFDLAATGDDAAYNFAVQLDSPRGFGSTPRRVSAELEAIIRAENSRHVPGASGLAKVSVATLPHSEAVTRFCMVLQFLCDAAGRINEEFKGGFFSKVVPEALTAVRGQPPELELLGVYCAAGGEDGLRITPELLKMVQTELSVLPEFAQPISDEWKIGSDSGEVAVGAEPRRESARRLERALRLCREDNVSNADGWKAFTISAACLSYQDAHAGAGPEDDLWRRLVAGVQAGSASFAEPLSGLVAQAGSRGLDLTASAAEAIESIAQVDSAAAAGALKCLLPLVERASVSEVARLRRWTGPGGVKTAKAEVGRLILRHATLMLAEPAVVLDAAWVGPLVDLLKSGDDRSKARAVRTLGGPLAEVKRGTRRRHVSAMEPGAIVEVLLCCLRACYGAERAPLVGRHLDDLHYDDPSVVARLAASAVPGSPGLSILHFVFGYGTWSVEALDACASWLNEGAGRWHDAFVIRYGSLLYYQEDDIPASLRSVIRKHLVSRRWVAYLLDEENSYKNVVRVCLAALEQARGAGAVARASSLLLDACRVQFDEHMLDEKIDSDCSRLGLSFMQTLGATPEDCWGDVLPHKDNEGLFELIFDWLVRELSCWSASQDGVVRPSVPEEAYTSRLRNALLSILTVMTEQFQNKFALMVSNSEPGGPDLRDLLVEVVAHNSLTRSKMAAVTLLSRLPSLNAEKIAQVFQIAVTCEPPVRDRAVLLLPHFRDFTPTPSFLSKAIQTVKGDEPASVVLAYAYLLARLLNENRIADSGMRREIVNTLRTAAKAPGNIRPLSHLAGLGTEKDPHEVVNDGRLDEKLLGIVAGMYTGLYRRV